MLSKLDFAQISRRLRTLDWIRGAKKSTLLEDFFFKSKMTRYRMSYIAHNISYRNRFLKLSNECNSIAPQVWMKCMN